MNCKPGDIAVNIGGERTEHHGAIVVVLRPYLEIPGRADLVIQYRGKEYAAWDRYLRPIHPQSDDAKDESAAWLPPVPTSREQEAA